MNENKKSQKYLGNKGLILFLAALGAFPPLSTDLYLPALPKMTVYFNASESLVNLTLVLFFVFFAVGTLFWGPLSDKYGRKPILIAGLICYVISGVLCGISANIYQLIVFRVLQAISGSAATAVATAVIKDVYKGRQREATLAIVQTIIIISPIVAPVIGAIMLKFTDWSGVFFVQGGIGLLVFLVALLYQETIEQKNDQGFFGSIGRLGVVLKNPGFRSLLFVFATMAMAFMSFIAGSSYIYQNTFGVSEQTFSYYFAFNALGMMIAPMLYMKLLKRFNRFTILNGIFLVMTLSGALIIAIGWYHPMVFALSLLPATIASGCSRPPATNLMLEQVDGDTGSASSLMISFQTIMGSIGVILVSIDTTYSLQIIGALNLILGIILGSRWYYLSKQPFLKQMREM